MSIQFEIRAKLNELGIETEISCSVPAEYAVEAVDQMQLVLMGVAFDDGDELEPVVQTYHKDGIEYSIYMIGDDVVKVVDETNGNPVEESALMLEGGVPMVKVDLP